MGEQTRKSNERVVCQSFHHLKRLRRVWIDPRSTVSAIDLEPHDGCVVGGGGVFNGIDGLHGVHEQVHREVHGLPGFAWIHRNRPGDVGESDVAEVPRLGKRGDGDSTKLTGRLQPRDLPHFVGLHMGPKVHSKRGGTASHPSAVPLQSIQVHEHGRCSKVINVHGLSGGGSGPFRVTYGMLHRIRCMSCVLVPALLSAIGCGTGDKDVSDSATASIDLVERLDAGEVRAGRVTDERALFGGISAEGRIGDFKIYNAHAQFIIQAPGDSNYYVGYGGSVIDADTVRPEGQMGRDLIDDGSMMVGLGRMFEAERVRVINDGLDGTAAVVRAVGSVAPLTILTGTLEADGLIEARSATVTIDYILRPESRLLELSSTVEWHSEATPVQLADMIFYSGEVAGRYGDTVGRDGDAPTSYRWTAAAGDHNDGVVAIMQGPDRDAFEANSILELVGDFGPLLVGSNGTITLNPGDTVRWSRFWGVGRDIATLVDEWLQRNDQTTEAFEGRVVAGEAPVAGARVHALNADGEPISMAVTDDDGRYRMTLAAGEAASLIAESRGTGIHFDIPSGAGWYGAYASETIRSATLQSIEDGASPVANSPGYGLSAAVAAASPATLELTPPGQLNVTIADGGPAVVRIGFADGDPMDAPLSVAHRRPKGEAAWAYIADGEMSVPLEPGAYRVVIHRGTTHEAVVADVTIASNESAAVRADLIPSVDTTGFRSMDPHSHASPSGDGRIHMEGRLLVTAAHGVDIHVGTDHDHVVDYGVLLHPLGLTDRLATIIADEVSPTLRGHHNAYPLESAPDEPNGGAFRWWKSWRDWSNTTGFHTWARRMRSDGDIILQANHPTGSSGLFGNAGYDPVAGTIAKGSHWSTDFDAVEVLNDGSYSRVFPYYLDLLNRGLNPTPVGVSDSHGHHEGMGVNRTWAPMALERIQDLSNDHVRDAILRSGTVASFGPLVVPTVDGAWAAGNTFTGPVNLTVEVRAPSWMTVDEIHVYENGLETQTIAVTGPKTVVVLDPSVDSVYVLTVTGADDMAPVYPDERPWALVQALFIDVDGDGWTPPLPSLEAP